MKTNIKKDNKINLNKKSSIFSIPNIKNKLKALILVYKNVGTPTKVVSQETFSEIFNEPNLSKSNKTL